jgi:hypothetical protein
MKVIPLIKCIDMGESLHFYTEVLDFEMIVAWPSTKFPTFCVIRKDNTEIHLSANSGDGFNRNVVHVAVKDVNELVNKFRSRGLDTTLKKEAPVQDLVDQTWCSKEFFVTDPSGNTLRFGQKLSQA